MQVIATHAGFNAIGEELEAGLEVTYRDAEGREIEREVFPGVTDYQLKLDDINAKLKSFGITESIQTDATPA